MFSMCLARPATLHWKLEELRMLQDCHVMF